MNFLPAKLACRSGEGYADEFLLSKARVASQCNRLGTALDLKFGKDCRDLVAHGFRTAAELLGNRLVIEAAREQLQDLILAQSECRAGTAAPLAGNRRAPQ